MTNPFSMKSLVPRLSNYPVKKGGPGSGRHGNGYTVNEIYMSATSLPNAIEYGNANEIERAADEHEQLAAECRSKASEMENNANAQQVAFSYRQAALAHDTAALAAHRAADILSKDKGANEDNISSRTHRAIESAMAESDKAAAYTEKAVARHSVMSPEETPEYWGDDPSMAEQLAKSVVRKGGPGSGRHKEGSIAMPDVSGIESALALGNEVHENLSENLGSNVESNIDDTEGYISDMESASDALEAAKEEDYDNQDERVDDMTSARDDWESALSNASSSALDAQSNFSQLNNYGVNDMTSVLNSIQRAIHYDEEFQEAFPDFVGSVETALEAAHSAIDDFGTATERGASYAKGFSEILSEYDEDTIDGWSDNGDFDGARENLDDASSALEDFSGAISDIDDSISDLMDSIEQANIASAQSELLGGRDEAIREAVADDDHATAADLHREMMNTPSRFYGDSEMTAIAAHQKAAELHDGAASVLQMAGKDNAAYTALSGAAADASEKAIAASVATL